jgi:hypothetical protein
MRTFRAALGPVAVVLLFMAGKYFSPFEPHGPPVGPTGAPTGVASWGDEDWEIFESTVRATAAEGADTLPMGSAMALVGRRLVGTPYVPGTLEVEGPERLVINFRGLDCVTFVENVYAIAALVKAGAEARLSDRVEIEAQYERVLSMLRYRGGFVDGYPSRLHYFSDWIADADRKLMADEITGELGGVVDDEPIRFMSAHPDAYRQLADEDNLEAIRSIEARLSARGRAYVPEDRIAGVSDGIRDGDIIAATSTIDGLDVAHTGIAIRIDGVLRLMHAPLVGDVVQISETSLAERILAIDAQDGIMVARPREPLSGRDRNLEATRDPRPSS